jgi:hypothetical protein
MKFFAIPLLLAGAGAGWIGIRSDGTYRADPAEPALASGECEARDCRVRVECTPRGTCLVTCYAEDGSVLCQEEIECDEPCGTLCASSSKPSEE